MIYKNHEIYARVAGTYSDLYSLKGNGELDESLDIILENNDEEVIWYEVELVDPNTGMTSAGNPFKTLEDAKKAIDESVKYMGQFK